MCLSPVPSRRFISATICATASSSSGQLRRSASWTNRSTVAHALSRGICHSNSRATALASRAVPCRASFAQGVPIQPAFRAVQWRSSRIAHEDPQNDGQLVDRDELAADRGGGHSRYTSARGSRPIQWPPRRQFATG